MWHHTVVAYVDADGNAAGPSTSEFKMGILDDKADADVDIDVDINGVTDTAVVRRREASWSKAVEAGP